MRALLIGLALLAGAHGTCFAQTHVLLGFQNGATFADPALASVMAQYGAAAGDMVLPQILTVDVVLEDAKVPAFIEAAMATGALRFAERDIVVPRTRNISPNDPEYQSGAEWHIDQLHLPAAWQLLNDALGAGKKFGDSSIVMANLDTGYTGAGDTIPNQTAGWNVSANSSDTSEVDHVSPGDGTMSSNVMAANTNNGTLIAGIAAGCTHMPIVIFNNSPGTSAALMAAGLDWAADHGVRVLSLTASLSGGRSAAVTAAMNYAWSKGVFIVAVGDDSPTTTVIYPAADPYAFSVSASGITESKASYASTGTFQVALAPGGEVTNCMHTIGPGGELETIWCGTSFSGPVAAAVAALALSANPSLNNADLATVMRASTRLVSGSTGWNSIYGYGLIDASKAVQAALASRTANVWRASGMMMGVD